MRTWTLRLLGLVDFETVGLVHFEDVDLWTLRLLDFGNEDLDVETIATCGL